MAQRTPSIVEGLLPMSTAGCPLSIYFQAYQLVTMENGLAAFPLTHNKVWSLTCKMQKCTSADLRYSTFAFQMVANPGPLLPLGLYCLRALATSGSLIPQGSRDPRVALDSGQLLDSGILAIPPPAAVLTTTTGTGKHDKEYYA
ncbi:hypothetical protein H109_06552 [Trichophyton interdigitale MR816]|uniref:Uncharacterized protein n=1 Tax=Trichophyton interdigitale (strain MR816) TaxID=1215338 RepID=A0A059J1E0_TRIIM|nr:hypothetical protein H109_06552 [Trichophyton interdigitale MR816]